MIGNTEKEKEKELKHIQIMKNMKEILKMIKEKEKEHIIIIMKVIMKEIGLKIKKMEMEN